MAPPLPPIVLLHGFTQSGLSWRPVVERLVDRQVSAPDLLGHGSASAHRGDLAVAASLVAEAIGPEPALVVGYSMGGRVALRLALDHPGTVAGLILLGATAGIDDPADRVERRRSDDELAASIERDGVESFVDRWLAQPLFAGLDPAADDLAARRANDAAGLAASLRDCGTGTMDPPWWDEVATIDVPTVVAWGERDHKFAALGRRLARAVGGNATTAVVPGAGHAAHLEQPDAFAALVAAWPEHPPGHAGITTG